MRTSKVRLKFSGVLLTVAMGVAAAQSVPGGKAAKLVPTAPTVALSQGATQQKLLEMIRVSPTLAKVVAIDPSLLSDTEYVQRNNPDLAEFLAQHPEIVRNPGYYLFSDLHEEGQRGYDIMRPKTGFEQLPQGEPSVVDTFGPFLLLFGFIAFILALFGLVRLLLENRRWGKIFGLQSNVHGQLIEKFGSSEALLTYMSTEAGKRFLEAAPIATEFDQKRLPNVVSRILTSAQVGVVLTMLGIGLLLLRNALRGANEHRAMLVIGMVVLMPGLGFILSAGATWLVSRRLGLMPGDSGQQQ